MTRHRYPGLPAQPDAEHPIVQSMRLLNPVLRRISVSYAAILSAAILPPHAPIPYVALASVAVAVGLGWSWLRWWLNQPW